MGSSPAIPRERGYPTIELIQFAKTSKEIFGLAQRRDLTEFKRAELPPIYGIRNRCRLMSSPSIPLGEGPSGLARLTDCSGLGMKNWIASSPKIDLPAMPYLPSMKIEPAISG